MRDTSCLRSRIALLACLPGLAAASVACSPPTKPQQVDQEDEQTRRRRQAMERRRQGRSNQLVPPGGEAEVDDRRLKFYAEKARREGKSVEDVTPPAQLELERQAKLREQRRRAAEKKRMRQEMTPEQMEARRAATLAKRKAARDGKAAATTPAATKEATTPHPVEPSPMASNTFPGDPPFIDGYNPEEEHCESGNWCGASDAVAGVAVPSVPMEMGCPIKIAGGKASDTIKGDPKTYAGLSSAPNMQGSLNAHGSELARADGDATTCCYHWFEYCSGRPHIGEHGPVLAPVEAGEGWGDTVAHGDAAATLPAALRQRIAQQWLEDARAEHASVAAFARTTLELMAVGAPPAMLAEAQRAGLDEIDHAQRCFALAGRYGGTPVRPGPLPGLAPREADLAQLAADTFAEGCVGETIAALVAQRAARHCNDADVRQSLEQIADDEARHAALAWSTLAWAIQRGGEPVVARLTCTARALRLGADGARPPADADAATLAAHGRLDARAHHDAAQQAWTDVIGPMLDTLLTDPAAAQRKPASS